MEYPQIGEDVSVATIVTTIFNCKGNSKRLMDERLVEVRNRMDLDSSTLTRNRSDISVEERYTDLLERWIQVSGGVRVDDFILVLRGAQLKLAAACLEKKYGPPSQSHVRVSMPEENTLLPPPNNSGGGNIPHSVPGNTTMYRHQENLNRRMQSSILLGWKKVKRIYSRIDKPLRALVVLLIVSGSVNAYLIAEGIFCCQKKIPSPDPVPCICGNAVEAVPSPRQVSCHSSESPNQFSLTATSITDLSSGLSSINDPNVNLTLNWMGSDEIDDLRNVSADNISHLILRGRIGPQKLITLLRIFSHVNSLTVDNTNGAICEKQISRLPLLPHQPEKIQMQCLKSLVIISASRCSRLFSIVKTTIELSTLREFRILNSNLDTQTFLDLNYIFSQQTLAILQLSLEDFNGLKILSYNNTKLSVKHLKLKSATEGPIMLQNKFCTAFEELQTLHVRTGYLLPEQFGLVANCKNIFNISTPIYLEKDKLIELSDMKFSSNLKNLSLILLFQSCPDVDEVSHMIRSICNKVYTTVTCKTCPVWNNKQDGIFKHYKKCHPSHN